MDRSPSLQLPSAGDHGGQGEGAPGGARAVCALLQVGLHAQQPGLEHVQQYQHCLVTPYFMMKSELPKPQPKPQ